jgi:hypothetical protein
MTATINSANAAASTLFLSQNGEWWDFWLIISLIFVALAAAAAGITTTGSIISHKREAIAAEETLERFKIETEDKITDSVARAAEANARAAEAKLELEKFKAPRFTLFNSDRQAKLSEQLKPFAGKQFDAGISVGDTECELLLNVLEVALKNAGLIQIDWKSGLPNTIGMVRRDKPTVGGVSAAGVTLEVDSKRHPELVPLTQIISDALNETGVAAQAIGDVATNTENADAMHVIIGKKM